MGDVEFELVVVEVRDEREVATENQTLDRQAPCSLGHRDSQGRVHGSRGLSFLTASRPAKFNGMTAFWTKQGTTPRDEQAMLVQERERHMLCAAEKPGEWVW